MFFRYILFIIGFFTFAFNSPLAAVPIVTSISPSSGTSAGGTNVTITGSGFTSASAVNFGNVPAASFTVNSDTSISATSPSMRPIVVDITVTVGLDTSATSRADLFTFQGEWFAYVTNAFGNTVTPIDLSTNTAGSPLAGFSNPQGIAITPDGQSAYVVNNTSYTLTPINLATTTLGSPLSFPFGGPYRGIAITPNGTKAYVTRAVSGNSAIPINLLTQTVGSEIPCGLRPWGVAITPDGSTAFVANNQGNTVTPINVATDIAGPAFVVGATDNPRFIAVRPGGQRAYVTLHADDYVAPFNAITPFTLGTYVTVGNAPNDIAITPNGLMAYNTNELDGSVSPIDLTTELAGAPIVGFSSPQGIAITPDGLFAYVANANTNSVTPLNLTTNTLGTPIAVGTFPVYLAISPDQAPLAVFTVTPGIAGTPTNFDASDSISPVGTIATYDWDFGDATTLSTASPFASHTYATANTYNVTLTVTNTAGTSTTQVFTGRTMSNNGGPTATLTEQVDILPPLPTITNVSPNTGFTLGGNFVTITGTNFINVTTVQFGAVGVNFTVNSPTSITAVAPPGVPGTVDIRVITESGISPITPLDEYTYILAYPGPHTKSSGSIWSQWTENPSDPIYDPYPSQTLAADLYPYVAFSLTKFDGNGDSVNYKMWHQGLNPSGSIALSNSSDGITWTLVGETNLTPAFHPVVLYDVNNFGVPGGKPYRMWFWNGIASTSSAGVIQFSESNDGITWDAPIPITQDITFPLVSGAGFFYQLYGPGFVIYNPNATSNPGEPYTFPYVMFYDIGQIDQTDIDAIQIGLAYSDDGIAWTRYGAAPIFFASGSSSPIGTTFWDASYVFRPSIINIRGVFHMYYSGSNQLIDQTVTAATAHGIGHASSQDGITWQRDQGNPVLLYSDEVNWRNSRTYTPFVLSFGYCGTKMWFTGGTGLDIGQNQAIGYATLDCP